VPGKPNPKSGAHLVTSPTQAKQEVARFARQKPDVIKIIFDYRRDHAMPKSVMKAIVQEAKKQKLKTVVHIGDWNNARDALEAGATAITHLCEDGVIPDSVVKAFKKSGAYSIPTMAVQLEMVNISEKPELLKRQLYLDVTGAGVHDGYKRLKEDPEMEEEISWQKDGREFDKKSLKKLVEAGIPLLTGSDAANYGSFQGYSLHREMELFSELGVPNWDVLRAATTRAGEFLGEAYGIGEGDWANLVLLKKNPVENIQATQEIEAVFFKGEKVDRQAILKESFTDESSGK
jgi:imidazolonepropionase-like amidohydrolase